MKHRENSSNWKLKHFAFFLLSGGLLSTYLGKDVDFDLLNYHYYNPWAFLHGRLLVDGFPASLQSFFNPTGDIPFFLATRLFPDYITVFLMGIPVGWALYVLWSLLGKIDSQRSTWHWATRALTCVLAISGAACLSQANTATGEVLVSTLVALGMSLCIQCVIEQRNIEKELIKAGLLLGLAAGLKLTSLVQVLAVVLSLPVLLYGRLGSRRAPFLFAGAIAIAFLVSAGPWMLKLYVNFRNPLFPFFNSVFHSPLLDEGSMRDVRFIPHNVREMLIFPLIGALTKNQLHTELPMRDPRMLLGSLISLWLLTRITLKRLKGEKLDVYARIKLFLAMTFVFGYVISMQFFGIYRYMIVEEFLAAIMAFIILADLITAVRIAETIGLSLLIYVGCFGLTVAPQWGSVDATGGSYFSATLPLLPSGAMVIDFTSQPISYLAPQWPSSPPIVKPDSGLTKPGFNERIQDILTRRIYSNTGPIYILLENHDLSDVAKQLLQTYQLAPAMSQCKAISGSVSGSLMICPTSRTSDADLTGFDYQRAVNTPFQGGYFPVKVGDSVWIGPQAFINFRTTELARHRSLLISGWIPFDILQKASPGMQSVNINIYVDGTMIGQTSVSKQTEFSLVLPSKLILSHTNGIPITSVEIRVSASVVPAKLGTSPDVRTLSAMINRAILSD